MLICIIQALILILIHSTRPTSLWKPYLDILPCEQDFNTLMYWTPEELEELRGSAVVEKIGREEAEGGFREKLWPVVKVW